MEIHLALLSLLLVVAASHAAVAADVFSTYARPNTPKPSANKDLVHQDELHDEKAGVSVSVGKGGVNVDTGRGTTVNVGHGGVHVDAGKGKHKRTEVYVGHGRKAVAVSHVNVGVNVRGRRPKVVVRTPYTNDFNYNYAATETQIHDDPKTTLFFQENDLRTGATMNVHFTKTTQTTQSLPRKTASSIPFSSRKFDEILNILKVEPNSPQAVMMKGTLKECEEPGIEGETKFCATSFESMVDFSTASLGTSQVTAISTKMSKAHSPEQAYTVKTVKKTGGKKLVACHLQPYAYTVFYCHTTPATQAYMLDLKGKDGTTVQAVALCHTDTAKWNPKHVAFQVLKVRPGTVPVCHFLPKDHVVWSTKQ